MMGIPILEASYANGDNMSVIYNTSKLESSLTKKCNSSFYHATNEPVVMGETLTRHVRSEDNLVDLLTKVATGH